MNFEYEELNGGLKVAVVSRHDAKESDKATLDAALFYALDREAEAHGASINTAKRNAKLTKALNEGKIEAWFMAAAWEACNPKIVGAAVEIPTVIIKKVDGKLVLTHGKYREDTCFRPDMMRELIKEKPEGMALPDIGLCEYFEKERIRLMTTRDPTGKPQGGRIAEFSAHSGQMIKVMKKTGATLGTSDTPIMELEGDAPLMFDRWQLTVETLALTDEVKGTPINHSFATNWTSRDGKQQVMATFTESISTFTGETVVRVQLASIGKPLAGRALEDVVASLLTAGQEEITINRKWGDEDKRSIFGIASPIMRIHALDEPEIAKTLKGIEAKVRKLGPHDMLPVAMALGASPLRPLFMFDSATAAQEPYFSFAANYS